MSRPWLTLGVIPALLFGCIVLPFVLYWGDLPNPMAVHWDLGGNPNGSMPPVALLLILAVMFAAIHSAVIRALSRAPDEAPSFIAGLFGLGALLASISWLSVLANRDQVTWESAEGMGILELIGVLVVAVVFGFFGWMVAGHKNVKRDTVPEAVPALDIAAPGAAVWSGRGGGRVLPGAGLALIGIGLATWGWTTLVLGFAGLAVWLFAEVRVTVSRNGALVSLGWLGVISWTVPLSEVSAAELEIVNPMSYGGWGYRLRPGVRAIITRSGEAMRLVRPYKQDLVMTVDDAETGAGLINALLKETAASE
jgi:hypothetical protein